MRGNSLNWRRIALLLPSLLLVGCAEKSAGCAPDIQPPAMPSLPSSAKQEPLPSWCSGDCLKTLIEWREAARQRLSEVE